MKTGDEKFSVAQIAEFEQRLLWEEEFDPEYDCCPEHALGDPPDGYDEWLKVKFAK